MLSVVLCSRAETILPSYRIFQVNVNSPDKDSGHQSRGLVRVQSPRGKFKDLVFLIRVDFWFETK